MGYNEIDDSGKEHAPEQQYCKPVSADAEYVTYFGAQDVVAEELEHIRKQHSSPNLKTSDLCGLALSGGGIRSASYSLGVMQALARNGWLCEIDYLSTVSGGGYIGSSLTWSLNSHPGTFGLDDSDFPFASFPMTGEARYEKDQTPLADQIKKRASHNPLNKWSGRMLNFLRQNAKYLTPGRCLNLFALSWVALRGACMGLLVYGTFLVLAFLLAFQCGALQEACILPFLSGALRQNWFVLAAVMGFGFWAITIPVYSVATYVYRWIGRGIAHPLRRMYEKTAGWMLPCLLALLVIGLVPRAHDFVKSRGADAPQKTETSEVTPPGNLDETAQTSRSGPLCATDAPDRQHPPAGDSLWSNLKEEMRVLLAGFGTLLLGLLSGIKTFVKTKSSKPGKIPQNLLVGLGVTSLLFGIFLIAYTVAYAVIKTTGTGTTTWLYICTGLAVALALAVFTNINHISIHRYYRDRLMETFMPNVDDVLAGKYGKAVRDMKANTKKLADMIHGPYHIINTNVILVNSHNSKLRGRGGDNFILSPLYCGSNATGWQWTKSFMKRGVLDKEGGMTLASAMAISGAALNPSTGCGGEGITRSSALSILMGMLNFRLGYWVPNPLHRNKSWRGKLRNPNFLLPGLWEVLLRNRLNENGSFLQLSDGGHFENLGLYELVRRKLKLIIVCDGGADPDFAYKDLSNAMEKVRTDFGALIMIGDKELEPLRPGQKDADGIRRSQRAYLRATIKYADNSKGTLVYLKTAFFKKLSADLYGYKKAHSKFPDQSTGDQFFDEKQFEAYRELGFQTAWEMMGELGQDFLST